MKAPDNFCEMSVHCKRRDLFISGYITEMLCNFHFVGFRVHNKPYIELKDSDGRSDQIVAEEVDNLHCINDVFANACSLCQIHPETCSLAHEKKFLQQYKVNLEIKLIGQILLSLFLVGNYTAVDTGVLYCRRWRSGLVLC